MRNSARRLFSLGSLVLIAVVALACAPGCGGRSVPQDPDGGRTGGERDAALPPPRPDAGVGIDAGRDVRPTDTTCTSLCECCGVTVEITCQEQCELGVCDPYCLFRQDGGADTGDDGSDGSDGGPRGDCVTDEDCGAEGECVAVPDVPDGWRTCRRPRAEATSCHDEQKGGIAEDQCCTSADCGEREGGGCFEGPLFYCGGPFPIPQNVCLYDECQADADCQQRAGGLCIPGGVFGEPRSRCVYGDCRVDRDCTAGAGGRCLPFFDPCAHRLSGFFCTYDSSACRTDEDCAGQPPLPYCHPLGGGQTECRQFTPPP